MAINKVIFGGEVKVDLTDATIAAPDLREGITAYGADGNKVTGTMVVQSYYTGSSEPETSLGNDGDLYLVVG